MGADARRGSVVVKVLPDWLVCKERRAPCLIEKDCFDVGVDRQREQMRKARGVPDEKARRVERASILVMQMELRTWVQKCMSMRRWYNASMLSSWRWKNRTSMMRSSSGPQVGIIAFSGCGEIQVHNCDFS